MNLTNKNNISILPSLLTLCNFACGLLSIMFCLQSIYWRGLNDVAKSGGLFEKACLMIFFGMIFDMLDGRVARMTNSQCEFGGQLDSFADACTFGIAPATILAALWVRVMPENAEWWSLALAAGLIYACCAVLRLAIYNLHISEEAKHHFSGLPSPGAAGAIIGAVLFFTQPALINAWNWLYSSTVQSTLTKISTTAAGKDYRVIAIYLFSVYVIIIGLLMVSHFRFAHAANIWLGKTKKLYSLLVIFLVITLLSVEATRSFALFLGFNAYVAICLFVNIRNRMKHREADIDRDIEEVLNIENREVDENALIKEFNEQ